MRETGQESGTDFGMSEEKINAETVTFFSRRTQFQFVGGLVIRRTYRAWRINKINRINQTNKINNGLINRCKLGHGLILY